MTLVDSGERQVYDSGAMKEPKIRRCDLLPLDVIAEFTEDEILAEINNYIRYGDATSLWIALIAFIDFKTEWTLEEAMLEVAEHYGEGALKYADRNWELGLPLHRFIDSGLAHYFKFMSEWSDEPHDRAFIWNMLGAIWTHKHHPEMIDLPFKEKQNENNNQQT
jgi:hypothetical protein